MNNKQPESTYPYNLNKHTQLQQGKKRQKSINLQKKSLVPKIDHNIISSNADQFDVIKNKKNFTVAVRIKPQLNYDISQTINISHKVLNSGQKQLKLNADTKKYEYGQNNQKKFVFDNVFDVQDRTQAIFQNLVEKKLNLLRKGVNLSIMAYGATNSGKTYTIFGKKQNQNSAIPTKGLSAFSFKKVYSMFSQQNYLSFSFVQIYNQNVYDLLSIESVGVALNVMQDSQGNTKVIGLNKVEINSIEELQVLINQGNEARISSNNMHNNTSSRSHAFMQMQIKNKITNQKTKLVIVDLAGSQKYIYSHQSNNSNIFNVSGNLSTISNNNSTILKQGSNINKSLLSLGNCIKSLYQNQQHIPYRDSKLTRLLKQNLSGYAHNIMIACINKKVANLEENLNSLNYALKAMKIQKQIVRKVQPEQISEYECNNCNCKISYALVKQIIKHEEHNKRVKTRQSQSLSISPISKNQLDFCSFKSKFNKSDPKVNYRKIESLIDQRFAKILKELEGKTNNYKMVNQILSAQKQMLKFQIKNKTTASTAGKNTIDSTVNFDQSIVVSQFQHNKYSSLNNQKSPLIANYQTNYQPSSRNTSQNQRKVKICLSRPKKKQIQRTASTIHMKNEDSVQKYQQSDLIKIQDSCSQNESGFHSFRSNLTVQIMNDKQKILKERKQLMDQKFTNKRMKSNNKSDFKPIFKSQSTQKGFKTKNTQNFIEFKKLQDPFQKIGILNSRNHIKIEDDSIKNSQIQNQNKQNYTCLQNFIINHRLLDSTTVAPRMKRDEQQMPKWNNMPFRMVQSPQLGNSQQKQQQESFVQYKIGGDVQQKLINKFFFKH